MLSSVVVHIVFKSETFLKCVAHTFFFTTNFKLSSNFHPLVFVDVLARHNFKWMKSMLDAPKKSYCVILNTIIIFCIGRPNYCMGRLNYSMGSSNYRMGRPNYSMDRPKYRLIRPNYRMGRPNYYMDRPNYQMGGPNYRNSQHTVNKLPNFIKICKDDTAKLS